METTQKHLTLEPHTLGKCFMKLKDVLKINPKFAPKKIYMCMNNEGGLTGIKYVKCSHVREQSTDKQWEALHSEVVWDWFRTHLNEENHVRLILQT